MYFMQDYKKRLKIKKEKRMKDYSHPLCLPHS